MWYMCDNCLLDEYVRRKKRGPHSLPITNIKETTVLILKMTQYTVPQVIDDAGGLVINKNYLITRCRVVT